VSERTPRITSARARAILKRHGFSMIGQSGCHQKWRNAETGKQVVLAEHRGKILPQGTLRSIMTGSGIPAEDWRK